MSKHTPGPWRANGPTGPNMQSYSQPFCIAGTGEYASTLIAGCFGDTRGGIEAAEANAILIAAAPDLLEALEEMLKLHAAHHNHMAHVAARAAISRATEGK